MAFSLVPVFMKKVWGANGQAYAPGSMGTGTHLHFSSAGNFVIASGGTVVPTGSLLGPVDLTLNGGCDIAQIIGAVKLTAITVTGTVAVTDCQLTVAGCAETPGEIMYRGSSFMNLQSTTNAGLTPAGETFAVYGAKTAGATPLYFAGGNSIAGSRTYIHSGMRMAGNPVSNSFPFKYSTSPPTGHATTGDEAVFSVWCGGPGLGIDGNNTGGGLDIGLSAFSRAYFLIKFVMTITGGGTIDSLTFSGGIGLIGYRRTIRGNPIEHMVQGVKPYNSSVLDYALG